MLIARQFNNAFLQIEKGEKVIKGLNRQLEKHVEHLDRMVEAKTRDIKSIMANIPQGIFMITAESKIHPDYSKHLEMIVDDHDLSGRDVFQSIFSLIV